MARGRDRGGGGHGRDRRRGGDSAPCGRARGSGCGTTVGGSGGARRCRAARDRSRRRHAGRSAVVQDETGGRVTLREGNIRFQAADGVVVSLRPGEALGWPLPPAFAPPLPSPLPSPPPPSGSPLAPSSPTEPAPWRTPTSAASAGTRPAADEALLDHVEELRSRGRFEQAARALRRALPGASKPMRELLSFELGSLLTHQIRDSRRACAQWAWHDRYFPDGRYRNEVARARHTLACPARSEAP